VLPLKHSPMEPIVRTYLRELEARQDVLGAAVFGSYARGDARPDGNIDIFVLISEGVHRDLERHDGKTYELLYASEKDALAFYAQNPDDCVTTWADAKIAFDKDGGLLRLRAYANLLRESGKISAAKSDIMHRKFEAEDKLNTLREIAKSDMSTAFMYLHELAGRLLEYRFNMIGHWTPPPKGRLSALRTVEPELAVLFDEFYSHVSWDGKIEMFGKLIKRTFE